MKKFLLIAIIFLAAILRLWQLGSVPPSPDWDEASLGYNAYSIMVTGRDEYGQFLPVVLRSFDDYKPALYAYLAIPSIKLFGLNVFAVRLPSAVFGVLTVLVTYFLVKELFRKWEVGNGKVALLTSFLLAISPWHIQFSRIAFESNVGLALNVLAVLLFLKGLRNHTLFIASSFFAGLSLHVYQSEKVFIPFLTLALLLIFRKQVVTVPKKYVIGATLIGLVLTVPLIWYIATEKEVFLRAKGVSFFSDQTPFLARTVEKLVEDSKVSDRVGLILDNRRVTYFIAAMNGYISHFNINWLFITGDEARHHAPNMGLLYFFELPFLLLGIYLLTFGNFNKRTKYLLLSWLLIAPIPASITTGVPHSIRTLNFLPTWQVFTAIGIIFAMQKISNLKSQISNLQIKYIVFTFCLLFFIFNFLYYLNQYFVQQNVQNSAAWQYGYREVVEEIKRVGKSYEKVVVTNKPHLDQSYMFFLFYLQYPPDRYQKEAKYASGGFRENHTYGKFEFRSIEWEKEEKSSRILYVGRPEDFPDNTRLIKTINFLDGRPAIKIVEG